MTTHLWRGTRLYLVGLLACAQNANCVRIATITNSSHDALSRVLKGVVEKSLHALILSTFKTLEKVSIGYLIIDDTTINKSYARYIEKCYWLWSTNDQCQIFGYNVVALMWSNGTITLPLYWMFYTKAQHKKDQKTKIDLTLFMMEWAKKQLNVSTKIICFDSFYSADAVLLRCEEYEWTYYTRVKSNRVLDGVQAKRVGKNNYWERTGTLSCRITARMIRHGKRIFLTNDFASTKQCVIDAYDARWRIEEVFRMLHDQLGLDECASRSFVAQSHHCMLSMVAYTLLARQKTGSEQSVYQLHDRCMDDTDFATLLVNSFVVEPRYRGA
jgi:putative transposase